MVYQLVDWGMGDSDIHKRHYAERDLLRYEQNQQQAHLDEHGEVDLHPLSNQVSFIKFTFVLFFNCQVFKKM